MKQQYFRRFSVNFRNTFEYKTFEDYKSKFNYNEKDDVIKSSNHINNLTETLINPIIKNHYINGGSYKNDVDVEKLLEKRM